MKIFVDDRDLLRHYVEQRSESAFTDLVRRHLTLVYATALRLVADSHMAQDIAQAVFILLARKASSIREGNALPGWLYRATRGIAKDTLRGERRRREREQEAMNRAELDIPSESSATAGESIVPMLDEAMQHLSDGEQSAVVLRFFEDKALNEVGRALEISEDAAQKRVSRALEKLRAHFVRRGLTVSVPALAATLTIPAAQAVPFELSAKLAPAAFAAGITAPRSGTIALSAAKIATISALVILTIIGCFLAIVFRRDRLQSTQPPFAIFRGVGDLPGGQIVSYASAVSGDGRVVVGLSQSTNSSEAFQWTLEGGITGLGDLPGGTFASSANGISADGAVIGGSSSSSSGSQAFHWTLETGIIGTGDLPGGLTASMPMRFPEMVNLLSARVLLLAGIARRFDGASLEFEPFNSQATAASADGSIVVGISAGSRVSFEAFRWTEATGMLGLGDFPGGVTNSNAYGVSSDGRFVVGYGCPGTFDPYTHEAFRWTEPDGLEHFGFAPGLRNSAAYAVSADGNVIVGDNKSESPAVALIWIPKTSMRRLQEVLTNDCQLDLKGWQLATARGVSRDGKTIVGTGAESLRPDRRLDCHVEGSHTSERKP